MNSQIMSKYSDHAMTGKQKKWKQERSWHQKVIMLIQKDK